MFILYVRDNCGYSQQVLDAFSEMKISFVEKNIKDPQALEELMTLGGEKQVPFLVDDEMEIGLYEANQIITYAKAHAPRKKE